MNSRRRNRKFGSHITATLYPPYREFHSRLPTRGIVGTEFEHGALAFFDLQNGLKLAIRPRKDIAHEIKVPLGPRGATECALGHNVASKAAVDVVMERARQSGAVITDPPHDAFSGGYNGSFKDPDGHLWEVVWNPDMEIVD